MPAEINTVLKPGVFHLTEGFQEYAAVSSVHCECEIVSFLFLFFPPKIIIP